MDNIPKELYRFHELQTFLLENFEIEPLDYIIGKYLPRGGIQLWIGHLHSLDENESMTLPQGVVISRPVNRQEVAKRSIIVYEVPYTFDLSNFMVMLDDYCIEKAVRWPKKGSKELSKIVELRFYAQKPVEVLLSSGKLQVDDIKFRISPKFIHKPNMCRVCKKINPGHSSIECKEIKCGKCSGDHSTRDHDAEDLNVKCPVCGLEHAFTVCPLRQKELKKSMKKQQFSYRDAVLKRKRKDFEKKKLQNLDFNDVDMDEFIQNPVNASFLEKLYLKLQEMFSSKVQSLATEPKQNDTPVVVECEDPHASKRAKPDADNLYHCSKGCNLTSRTAGPISKHEKLCTGEEYHAQTKARRKIDERYRSSAAKKLANKGNSTLDSFMNQVSGKSL